MRGLIALASRRCVGTFVVRPVISLDPAYRISPPSFMELAHAPIARRCRPGNNEPRASFFCRDRTRAGESLSADVPAAAWRTVLREMSASASPRCLAVFRAPTSHSTGPVRRARDEPARVPRTAAIGLHLPRARRVHGGEVRIGDDGLMPQRLETPRDAFTVGRGLDDDPPGPPCGDDRGCALMGTRRPPCQARGQPLHPIYALIDGMVEREARYHRPTTGRS